MTTFNLEATRERIQRAIKEADPRIERAMASIRERDGYCVVASESETLPHIVQVDEHMYSTECTCKAGHDGLDCYHRIAVDRYYDDRRPSFYERHGLTISRERMETAPLYRQSFSILR